MTEKPKTKSPRWMKILLVVSLAFNFLVVGAVASKVLSHRKHYISKGPHGKLARPGAMRSAGRHLMWKMPRERRKEMRQFVHEYRQTMQPELTALADARKKLADLIASKPAGDEMLTKAWDQVKQAETALHTKANGLTRAFIDKLTPDERRTYAKILLKPRHKRWFGRRP